MSQICLESNLNFKLTKPAKFLKSAPFNAIPLKGKTMKNICIAVLVTFMFASCGQGVVNGKNIPSITLLGKKRIMQNSKELKKRYLI